MYAIYKKIEANNALFGLCCVLIATLGLSLKAILIKQIYYSDPSIDAISMLALRLIIAMPFFVLILYLTKTTSKKQTHTRRNIVPVILLGSVGFYLSSLLDFTALAYIPAGLERLILFLYPTFVVIISLFMQTNEVSKRIFTALSISYIGIIIVFIEKIPELNTNMMTGVALAFAAAVIYAIYTVMSVTQIRRHGSIRFTVYAMIAATMTTLLHALISNGLSIFNQTGFVYGLILLMAIFSTVMPLILIAEGIKRIGASRASIINTSGPPLTLAMAFFILGETIGILQVAGGAMILIGVFLVSSKK